MKNTCGLLKIRNVDNVIESNLFLKFLIVEHNSPVSITADIFKIAFVNVHISGPTDIISNKCRSSATIIKFQSCNILFSDKIRFDKIIVIMLFH